MAAVRRVCVSVLCLVISELCVSSSQFPSIAGLPPAKSQFAHHRTFRPSVYHGREKRHLQHTRQKDGHVNELSVFYSLDNDSYILDLRLNRDLLPDDYFEKYHQNGEEITRRGGNTDRNRILFCHYQGQIRHVPNSWVALSTCAGLSGVIFDGRELHYIEPRNGSSLDDEHLIMKHSDLTVNFTCGTHSALPHSSHSHLRAKRQINTEESAVRGPFKANSRSRYVELVLVVDNKSYENQDKDLKRVFRRTKDIANIVNALYAPLNIFIALVGVVVWTEKDEIQISIKGDETLTNFLHYRRVRLVKEHPNDNAQLLTGIQFQGGVVGKALKGPMCTYEFSGGVAMDHSPIVGLVATTVAHEMGHNFGMEHDNDSLCHCPDDKCIMAASSSAVSPTHWSSCSLENLALAFEHGMDHCLRNKPASLFKSPECGNMFVEAGEECDCGLPDHCDNPCCNPHTCKLHVNATCAIGECCDTATCRTKKAGTLCRSALQECDLPEYCTGSTEYCPNDFHKLDGASCGQNKAYCYEGSCRSHSDQCRLLWGPSGKGSDLQCYKQNTHGNKTGNCGYLKFSENFLKCREENINCGLLHCSHLNERLEFGMESVAVLSHSFFNVDGKIIPCRTANVDLGLQDVDPGLVPNGAKCGDKKMCVNQTCVAVSSVVKAGCPQKCNSNGECNNLGKCHCKVGFAPPHCDYPGPGGSEDGGPASDPNVTTWFVVAMFVIFLGIVPLLTLIFCYWYCCRDRHQRAQLWAKIQRAPKLSLPTRSSPDFTQPPSSSNSSTASSPSRRIQQPRRFFWPISLWTNKSSSRPIPADDPAPGTKSVKVEISRPIPLHPTSKQGNGNSTSVPVPPASLAQNLVGQFRGFKLSPLSEHAESGFGDAAQVSPPAGKNGVHKLNKETNKPVANNGVVAARASFFSNGSVSTSSGTPTTSSVVPVRQAPAAPPVTDSSKRPHGKSAPQVPIQTLGHTEIVITKTVVPEPVVPQTLASPKKGRPLSSPNVYSVKAIFGRSENTQAQQQAPGNTSTLQKMASLFKPISTQNTVVVNGEKPLEVCGPPTGGSSLPRQQSIKAAKLNRESLRGLEISNPIPQNAVELPAKILPLRPAPAPPPPPPLSPTSKLGISSTLPRLPKANKVHFADGDGDVDELDGDKLPSIIERSESMRLRGINRPNIPQFGSMRTKSKRPLSMPFARPTSPPPNPPGASSIHSDDDHPYDDCSRVPTVQDDAPIYASIEELQMERSTLQRDEAGSTTTTNSDGLLSEIVLELKKKNLDEAYATKVVEPVDPANLHNGKDSTTIASKPTSTAPVTPPKTVASLKSSISPTGVTKPIPVTKSSQAASKTIETTISTTSPSTSLSYAPAYKPYSSSLAMRNRNYLGGAAAGSTAASSKTTPSSQAIPAVMSTTSSLPKVPIASVKPTVALSTKPGLTTDRSKADPVRLPQQPPVGKASTPPKASINSESVGKTATSSGDGKDATATAKAKMTNMKTPLTANKITGAIASTGPTNQKIVKSTPAPTHRPNTVPTTTGSNKPLASPSSSTSPSSLGSAASGKNPSSSLVQSLQQKFDSSNKGGSVTSSNKTAAAQSIKNRSNQKL